MAHRYTVQDELAPREWTPESMIAGPGGGGKHVPEEVYDRILEVMTSGITFSGGLFLQRTLVDVYAEDSGLKVGTARAHVSATLLQFEQIGLVEPMGMMHGTRLRLWKIAE